MTTLRFFKFLIAGAILIVFGIGLYYYIDYSNTLNKIGWTEATVTSIDTLDNGLSRTVRIKYKHNADTYYADLPEEYYLYTYRGFAQKVFDMNVGTKLGILVFTETPSKIYINNSYRHKSSFIFSAIFTFITLPFYLFVRDKKYIIKRCIKNDSYIYGTDVIIQRVPNNINYSLYVILCRYQLNKGPYMIFKSNIIQFDPGPVLSNLGINRLKVYTRKRKFNIYKVDIQDVCNEYQRWFNS